MCCQRRWTVVAIAGVASCFLLGASYSSLGASRPSAAASAASAVLSAGLGGTVMTSDGADAEERAQARAEAKALLNVTPGAAKPKVVHVFSFDKRGQMHRMLFQWLLAGSHTVSNATGVTVASVHLQELAAFQRDDIVKAFERAHANATRPDVAVWLFPFKDGDKTNMLKLLTKLFRESVKRNGLRHIVFHWSPEFCDQGGATLTNINAAYKFVDTVFMFGYMDERLAQQNKNKYMPFPLGPALLRGWETPKEVSPTGSRPLLAAYRGSASTHLGLIDAMQRSVLQLDGGDQKKVVLEERKSWTMEDTGDARNRYMTLLATARFAVSPPGHNPNTYRVVEAVESGSTPVIIPRAEKCYENWAALYGIPAPGCTRYDWIPAAPFMVLHDWGQLGPELRSRLHDSKDETVVLQRWYQRWRSAFQHKLAERITTK